MKFQVKNKIELGTLRIKKRFAFFPVSIHKNLEIWLETYYTLDRYCQDVFCGQKRGKVWRVIDVALCPEFLEYVARGTYYD